MKRTHRLLSWNLLAVVILAGCSQKADETGQVATDEGQSVFTVTDNPVTIQDTIHVMINEAVQRVRHGDKSFLYEMEFPYLTDSVDFDTYLKKREIQYARADSVEFLEIVDLKLYEHDSAMAALNVHFEGPTGVKTVLPDTIYVYYYDGRWIKPTASKIKQQLEYEKAKSGK